MSKVKLNSNIGYVYKITNPKNKVYIGSTSLTPEIRWKAYKCLDCKLQIKLYRSLRKYGYNNHIFETLWCGSISDMLKYEAMLGIWYEVLDNNKGLNLRIPKISDRFMSISNKTREKLRKLRIGFKYSQLSKNKMRLSKLNKPNFKLRGFKHSNKTKLLNSINHSKKPILQYSLSGDFIKAWINCEIASKSLNVNSLCINRAVKGIFKKGGNYQWRYKTKEYPLKIDKLIPGKAISILQYDLNDTFLREWDSIAEIEDYYGKLSHISDVLSNKRNSTKGYKFKYK